MREVTNDPSLPSLVFVPSITFETATGKMSVEGMYGGPKDDTVYIASGSIREKFPPEQVNPITLIIAAHETRHRVQVRIFGEKTACAAGLLAAGAYADDRHEVDAWETAMRIFEGAYPHTPTSIGIGGRQYATSNYRPY